MKKWTWLALLMILSACNGSMKVMKTGLGAGRVTSSPAGVDCGTDCGGELSRRQHGHPDGGARTEVGL